MRTGTELPATLDNLSGSDIMKVRDIIKEVEADDWQLLASKGSHRQFVHPTKPGKGDDSGPSE